MKDLIGTMMEYESGELSDLKTLKLFSFLIKSGRAWELQGSYGHTAHALIQDDWISKEGKINSNKVEQNGI